jgi:hypothetical protein
MIKRPISEWVQLGLSLLAGSAAMLVAVAVFWAFGAPLSNSLMGIFGTLGFFVVWFGSDWLYGSGSPFW